MPEAREMDGRVQDPPTLDWMPSTTRCGGKSVGSTEKAHLELVRVGNGKGSTVTALFPRGLAKTSRQVSVSCMKMGRPRPHQDKRSGPRMGSFTIRELRRQIGHSPACCGQSCLRIRYHRCHRLPCHQSTTGSPTAMPPDHTPHQTGHHHHLCHQI